MVSIGQSTFRGQKYNMGKPVKSSSSSSSTPVPYTWTGTVEEIGEDYQPVSGGHHENIVGGITVTPEVYNATQQELTKISTTPTISQQQKQQQQQAVVQAVAGKFSGKVEEEGGGRAEYYVRGKEVARFEGGQLTKSEPSFFEFRTETPTTFRSEAVTFNREGMQSSGYEQTRQVQVQQSPSDLLFGGRRESGSYMDSSGIAYEVNEFGAIKEINPQGFSYKDPLTGRGYEVTPLTRTKITTDFEKAHPGVPSLTSFNEMYYGTREKIGNVISLPRTFIEGFSSQEVKEANLLYEQKKETRSREKFMSAPFISKFSPEKQEYLYAQSKPIAYGLISSLIPFTNVKVPMKITIPERELAGYSISKEASVNVIKGGKQVRVSNYNLFTEVKPPRTILTRVKGQGLLDAKEVFRPSQFIKTTTPFNVHGEEAFTTFSAKNVKYGRTIGVERVSPIESNVISPSEFTNLPKIEKMLFQRMVEARVGKPVSLKLVPKFLSKEKIYVRSSFDVTKTGRVAKIKAGEYDLLKPLVKEGKTTSKYLTISEVTETGETKLANLYRVDTQYKDITKPFSRATGKTQRLITKGAELKQPIVLDIVKDVNFISPANIQKTPMSTTFAEQIVKQSLSKALPKIIRQPKTTAILKQPTQLPSVVPSSLISQSLYSGTGMYERTEGGQVPRTIPILTQNKFMTSSSFKTIPLMKEESINRSGFKNRELFKEETILSPREELVPRTENIMKEVPRMKEVELQKFIQKQKYIQKQKFIPRQPIPRFPTNRPPRFPRTTEPRTFGFKLKPTRFNLGSGKLKLLVKEKGLWKAKGLFSDIGKATQTGKFLTGKDITRSFKIEGAKGILPTGYRFARKKGRQIKNVFVELPKTALSQKQEQFKIRYAKIMKGGKKKNKWDLKNTKKDLFKEGKKQKLLRV